MKEKLSLGTPGGYTFNSTAGMPDSGLSDLQSIVKWGTTVLMITAVLLTIFFLIWGGIEWITSTGDKEKLAKAQKKIIYASIGLIITLGAFFIVNFVGNLFDINFF